MALSPLRALASSPIDIVVPYAPGGTADALARLISQYLGPKLHASVVVLNKAGASGVIGERFVAEARADGLTLLYDATPFAINPSLEKLPFDPQKDLVPVTMVARTPMLLCVPKSSPFHSLQDLIAAAKARPGKLTFGSGGQGTVQYMGAELFCQGAGIKMLHVPYRSGGPALTAIAAGEIDLGFGNLPAVSAQVKGGLMKALAITSPQRNPAFPDVPTIAEAAVPHYQSFEWNGMFAPKGTSREAVEQLQVAVKDVLEMPDVKSRFDSLGSTIVASTPDEFRKFLAEDIVRWSTTVKNAGIHKE
ncbi:MAG: tripartite tricarboxylate transporter substrate binding protein [Burkholderiales bacterium]|nr:tripartite tricarboxylate transporter substrate binding protein [Burkholderiales bacterium]MDE2398794.1 tripartite tricarboxylate transporter substrate binding protein [Burkholderiales bacterium]MDE2455577.1 tripartite tricarboxylate transporter substrate binding protein [Burkholderiales bacterium]